MTKFSPDTCAHCDIQFKPEDRVTQVGPNMGGPDWRDIRCHSGECAHEFSCGKFVDGNLRIAQIVHKALKGMGPNHRAF